MFQDGTGFVSLLFECVKIIPFLGTEPYTSPSKLNSEFALKTAFYLPILD